MTSIQDKGFKTLPKSILVLVLVLFIGWKVNSSPLNNEISPILDNSRDPKTLMYFPFIKLVIPPEPCGNNINPNTNGAPVRSGVCLPPGGCKIAQGTTTGDKCNNGFGECCQIATNCTADRSVVDVKEYVTVLNTPSPINSQCTFRLRRKKDACQVRLDFINYVSQSADTEGNCQNDRFRVGNSVTTPEGFTTCGTLTGQHMYLTFGSTYETIDINPTIMNSGSYQIVATQIPCYSRRVAPSYCLQHFNRSSDIVKSFDYGNQQQNNQRYTICVDPSEQSSSIRWKACSGANDGPIAPGGPFYISTQPVSGDLTCQTDWIQINGENRRCGNSFPNMVTSLFKPYTIGVNFDDEEAPLPGNIGSAAPANDTISCENLGASSNGVLLCVWDPPTGTCQCNIVGPVPNLPLNPGGLHAPDVDNVGFCLRYQI